MANIDTSYLMSTSMPVQDTANFMSSGLPEITRVKSLMAACKQVFKLNNNMLQLNILDNRVYEIDIFNDNKKSQILGKIYYLPLKKQLDVYDMTSEYPCISWINRRIQVFQFSGLISKMKIDALFQPLVNSVL